MFFLHKIKTSLDLFFYSLRQKINLKCVFWFVVSIALAVYILCNRDLFADNALFLIGKVIGMILVAVLGIVFVYDSIAAQVCRILKKDYKPQFADMLSDMEWDKWAVLTFFLIFGVFYILPDAWVGEADFRADKQKQDYVAYYECEYDIYAREKGSGILLLERDDGEYKAVELLTEKGRLRLGLTMDEYEIEAERVIGTVGDGVEIDIDINKGPLDKTDERIGSWGKTILKAEDLIYKEIVETVLCYGCFMGFPVGEAYTIGGEYACADCLYREFNALISQDVGKCEICGFHYFKSDTFHTGVCSYCEEGMVTDCYLCGEYVRKWGSGKSDFAICSECLEIAFRDFKIKNSITEYKYRGE